MAATGVITITVHGGAAWSLPGSGNGNAAGVRYIGCNQPSLAMVYGDLPGESGVNSSILRVDGMDYDITDGAKSGGGVAVAGDLTQGGSTQHLRVRYNSARAGWVCMCT